MLLHYGANRDLCEDKGWAPIHIACQKGHTGVVEELVTSGADVNQTATDNLTCLYIAAYNQHNDVSWLLM